MSYYCCCWCYGFYSNYCLPLNYLKRIVHVLYFNYSNYYKGIFYYGWYVCMPMQFAETVQFQEGASAESKSARKCYGCTH